ncbi:hypothetical protein CCP3SC15_590004 [Gammaproteobacteria bacterium]
MISGGALLHGETRPGFGEFVLFDRQYFDGVGLISFIGMGVCPKYTGPEKVLMEFLNAEDVRMSSGGKIKIGNERIVHRIDFPATFLQRAKLVYEAGKKLNDEIMNRLLKAFLESR